MKKKVSLLITDMDNTLFDWFESWYESFKPMLECLIKISGIDHQTLIREIRQIHQRHGTAEYYSLLQELPSLQEQYNGGELDSICRRAAEVYRHGRQQHLRLYPGVLETLTAIKQHNCLIVVYTESQAFYSAYRIRELGLDGIVSYLYSPQGHNSSTESSVNDAAFYDHTHVVLETTLQRHTPKGEIKPNPDILTSIIDELKVPTEHVIYVGDSLTKDIKMAQLARVTDVYAEFGVPHKQEGYDLLRSVTHWTEEEVEKERFTAKTHVVPTYSLQNSYCELLEIFDFGHE